MKKSKLAAIVLGMIVILLAPILGVFLSYIYLLLIGGMETEKFLIVMKACITGFQIIGVLLAVYSMLKIHHKE